MQRAARRRSFDRVACGASGRNRPQWLERQCNRGVQCGLFQFARTKAGEDAADTAPKNGQNSRVVVSGPGRRNIPVPSLHLTGASWRPASSCTFQCGRARLGLQRRVQTGSAAVCVGYTWRDGSGCFRGFLRGVALPLRLSPQPGFLSAAAAATSPCHARWTRRSLGVRLGVSEGRSALQRDQPACARVCRCIGS
jgi:hypothetical protein